MKDEQNLENGWCLETNFQFFFSDIPKWNVQLQPSWQKKPHRVWKEIEFHETKSAESERDLIWSWYWSIHWYFYRFFPRLVKLSCCASTRRRWRSISLPKAWQTTLWRECSRRRLVLHVEKNKLNLKRSAFCPWHVVFLRWCAWPTKIWRTSKGRIHCWEVLLVAEIQATRTSTVVAMPSLKWPKRAATPISHTPGGASGWNGTHFGVWDVVGVCNICIFCEILVI